MWVLYSVYRYARTARPFRLRSRWMLVFDGARYAWRRLQARLHGHEHVEPLEMSSYGTRTALGVGMIHGIGAETGTQVLLIAAVGGAASAGLGVPMLLAFVLGLLISNFAIVVVSSVGFVASQKREMIYVAVGAVAGVFSLVIGSVFLFGLDERAAGPGVHAAVLRVERRRYASYAAAVAAKIRLGLGANAGQFALLVGVNALVGAMVGQERSILPLLAEQEFGLTSASAALTFLVAFGLAKAFANLGGRWAGRSVRAQTGARRGLADRGICRSHS